MKTSRNELSILTLERGAIAGDVSWQNGSDCRIDVGSFGATGHLIYGDCGPAKSTDDKEEPWHRQLEHMASTNVKAELEALFAVDIVDSSNDDDAMIVLIESQLNQRSWQ
jgi:DNA topoisomerase VI subunit A